MIARFRILIPPIVGVSTRDELSAIHREACGCAVVVHPPYHVDIPPLVPHQAASLTLDEAWQRLERPMTKTPPSLLLNGEKANLANAICVDFVRENFDRRHASPVLDPPPSCAFEVVNEIFGSARALLGVWQLRPIREGDTIWRIDYFDNDGQRLPREAGLIGGQGAGLFCFACAPFTPEVWNTIAKERPTQKLWDSLLLDAKALLPDVGPAIVLASAALEVFIAAVLDSIVDDKVPRSLWDWINDRGDWRKDPSLLEQFDILLKTVTGHSLKDDERLCVAFAELKNTRDAFSHEGVAVLGKRRTVVSPAKAEELVSAAEKIIQWVEQFLPETLRRPRVESPDWNFVRVLWSGDEEPDPSRWRFEHRHR
jgi:hypothetical protein